MIVIGRTYIAYSHFETGEYVGETSATFEYVVVVCFFVGVFAYVLGEQHGLALTAHFLQKQSHFLRYEVLGLFQAQEASSTEWSRYLLVDWRLRI